MSDEIRNALADPEAPWYGSDLVPLVAERIAQLEAENATLRKRPLAQAMAGFPLRWVVKLEVENEELLDQLRVSGDQSREYSNSLETSHKLNTELRQKAGDALTALSEGWLCYAPDTHDGDGWLVSFPSTDGDHEAFRGATLAEALRAARESAE